MSRTRSNIVLLTVLVSATSLLLTPERAEAVPSFVLAKRVISPTSTGGGFFGERRPLHRKMSTETVCLTWYVTSPRTRQGSDRETPKESSEDGSSMGRSSRAEIRS